MSKICTCEVCNENLIKPNNGKLQVWYGTGNNGKTTLLNEVIKKVEENGKNVKYLTTEMFTHPDYDYDVGMLEENIGLYVILESNIDSINDIVSDFEQYGNKFVRHIVTTNTKPQQWWSKTEVIEFTHTF